MAIDGRMLLHGPEKPDAYESTWVRVVSAALIWVPLAAIVVFAYVSGTWMGGPVAGWLSVGSTALTAAGVWAWRRFIRRRR